MANDTNTRWQEFNAIIDDERLDAKEKGLLLILFRYVNYIKGYAEPSRSLIKKLYGTNKNDVLDKTMNSLIDKGFLIRQSGKGRRSNYFVKLGTQIEPSTTLEPSTQIEPIVGTQIEPIVGSQIEPQKEKKRKVKEYIYIDLKFVDEVIDKVKITQEHYDTLVEKYNKEIVHENIIALDNYIANGKGSKYKDHYRALNTWCGKSNKSQVGKTNTENSWEGMKKFN